MSKRYQQSEEFLSRALEVIPLGSQTFSKSMLQFPYGAAPFFIERGKGAHVWDVDGNEYVDFVNGLLSVSIGYDDPDVLHAVQTQLHNGVSFSLPHKLETLLAEKIVAMVPCAEMVRFGKNGSDATAGAIRLARAYTGRDHVAVCGYHGWQDWYIGSTTRNSGVPKATTELTHQFVYNDILSLEKILQRYPKQIAAVIMEPMNIEYPRDNFLQKVKELTHKYGALFILDETITGFRFALGGAQEYFNVIPDLATFGKGMANGYPLAVVVGRKDIMQLMEEIFFSFTFGGETLSLAAAYAVLNKMQREPVLEKMKNTGEQIIAGVQRLITEYQLENTIQIKGHPVWSFLMFQAAGSYSQLEIKTLWMQEILKRGILSFGTHNISYAHTSDDVQRLLSVYKEVFSLIKDVVTNNNLPQHLHCEPLKPLFKVR